MGLKKNIQENENTLSALLEGLADRMGIKFDATEPDEAPQVRWNEEKANKPHPSCREIDLATASITDKLQFVLHDTLDSLINGSIVLESAEELEKLISSIHNASYAGISIK